MAQAIGERSRRGRDARRSGRRAEWLCALWLMAKGYRILGFRIRTPQAEIDILAQKRGVTVVVEVKRRTSLVEALQSVKPRQRERLRRAAAGLVGGRAAPFGQTVRLDLIALAPGRLPRHIVAAWLDE